MTSPSPGTISFSAISTMSPLRRAEEPTSSSAPSAVRRCATVSVRVLRSVAAWALPRASARASAYVAKSTVNQSQAAIWIRYPRSEEDPVPGMLSRMPTIRSVTRMAVISTTNMTGLRTR